VGKKLAHRHAAWVMPLLLTLFMTCVVSLISTYKALGVVPHFGRAWMAAWGWSWLVAFPAVLVVLPLVRRLTAVLVDVRTP
jgi:Protein of unknown function (DUF2798)